MDFNTEEESEDRMVLGPTYYEETMKNDILVRKPISPPWNKISNVPENYMKYKGYLSVPMIIQGESREHTLISSKDFYSQIPKKILEKIDPNWKSNTYWDEFYNCRRITKEVIMIDCYGTEVVFQWDFTPPLD